MTKIEWTDDTVNPIVGCSKVSPACDNCYAERMAKRLRGMGLPQYQSVVDANGWTGQIGFDWNQLKKLNQGYGKKIFISSMGDLFHDSLAISDIETVFHAIVANSQNTYQILTKRPENMLKIVPIMLERVNNGKPIENLWLGVTAENQTTADYRIPFLLGTPAAIRFVSVEPMLSEVDLHLNRRYCPRCGGEEYNNKCLFCREAHYITSRTAGIDWVIAGPETGPHKRKCEEDWIEDLQSQCAEFKVPFFLKKNADGTPSNIHRFPEVKHVG